MAKSSNKKFKLLPSDIIDLVPNIGGCIATDKITVDGLPVGYMYKDEAHNDLDNGWRFFSGTEDQEYIDNLNNSSVYDTNSIANYDPCIIPYLHLPIGTKCERNIDNSFSCIIDDTIADT